jgi:REP element-mobilizing transposase RayT
MVQVFTTALCGSGLLNRTLTLPILQRPDLIRRYWKGVLWSPSYFAASRGGAPINILKTYIERQKTPL